MRSALLLLVLTSPSARCFRVPAPRMGLLDGAKEAFSASGAEKPLVAADRVTPFDRWLGLDKELVKAEQPSTDVKFVDPNSPSSYLSTALSKPMGIAFVENDECGGVYIDQLLSEGSASTSSVPLMVGDQLVAVEQTLLLGSEFDEALDAIKGAAGDTVKLTFFRGPAAFLYGPTKATPEWYAENVL